MPLYDIAFYCASFFLGGVALAGLGADPRVFLLVIGIGFFGALAWGIVKRSTAIALIAFFCAVLFTGFFYYHLYLAWTKPEIALDTPIEFRGAVSSYPEWRATSQKFELTLGAPDRGTVSVLAPAYPRFSYGDVIRVNGKVSNADTNTLQVLFPKIERIGHGAGNPITSALFAWKESMISTFQKTLAPTEAALLAGLTFGDRAGFSKEFQAELQQSGTTHIVALSGYNISLIVSLVGVLFSYFLSRRASFFASIFAIILFIISTGAEASAVRAAVMGVIALLAIHVGRLYSFRNAITFAALAMILINPRTLVFDVGFQLSFAALLGIVYLLPAIQLFFKFGPERGLFGWRENALASCAAELAVIPIILKYFGAFSLFSLAANVLILEVVPILTILGFALGFLGYLSSFLSALFALVVEILLRYIVGVIRFFSWAAIPVALTVTPTMIAVYYALLILFVCYSLYGTPAKEKKK